MTGNGSLISEEVIVVAIPGVCDGCKRRTIDSMRDKGIFEKDAHIIEGAIAEVKQTYGAAIPSRFGSPDDN
jgi:hypothetical protein